MLNLIWNEYIDKYIWYIEYYKNRNLVLKVHIYMYMYV